jgi:2-dehydropantoate 2-reductase
MMRIAIYGTGGAGGYFGARLAQAGTDVTFIARGDHLRAIQERGLLLESDKESTLVTSSRATDDPSQVGPVDAVIVGVKSWQVMDAAHNMRPMIGPDTFVVPLQNGVEAASQLQTILGEGPVLGGLCATFSWLVGPGHIRSVGEANFIKFGELSNQPSERSIRLQKTFERAGVKSEIPANIQAALWEKLLLVASHGGVGTVTRAPVGVIRSLPQTRLMIETCTEETYTVARTRKIVLTKDAVAKAMAFVDSIVPDATTSLHRDIAAGRPSELEAWNGAIVRLGKEAGVATPLHEFIYHSLLPLELLARGTLQFSVSIGK